MVKQLLVKPFLYLTPLSLTIFVLISYSSRPWPEVHPNFWQTIAHKDLYPCRIWSDWSLSDQNQLFYSYTNPEDKPVIGDPDFVGDGDRCLPASSRLDQYRGDHASNAKPWSKVRWGKLQKRCAADTFGAGVSDGGKTLSLDYIQPPPPRTAVILRSWDDFEYNSHQMAWLRAFITETSLHSGGEMQVFLLVHVRDDNLRILDDRKLYKSTLRSLVPREFQDMTLLWNKRFLESWYPNVAEHDVKLQMYQALQIFAQNFQKFSFFYQVEMDFRLTSHAYTTLSSAAAWAREQPRKHLWERNGRWYMPSLFNNTYASFAANVSAENPTRSIWGPMSTTGFVPQGPAPPPRDREDWGIGEEADVISFMPLIDPIDTDWVDEAAVGNFSDGLATPRRYANVAITRTSRRLLQLVHEAQRDDGRWLASEATMETFALLHGLKAVFVPHGIAFAGGATAEQLDAVVNRGPVENRAGGWQPSVSYSTHGFTDQTWFAASYWWYHEGTAGAVWRNYTGGQCLPPMLLHPVKNDETS